MLTCTCGGLLQSLNGVDFICSDCETLTSSQEYDFEEPFSIYTGVKFNINKTIEQQAHLLSVPGPSSSVSSRLYVVERITAELGDRFSLPCTVIEGAKQLITSVKSILPSKSVNIHSSLICLYISLLNHQIAFSFAELVDKSDIADLTLFKHKLDLISAKIHIPNPSVFSFFSRFSMNFLPSSLPLTRSFLLLQLCSPSLPLIFSLFEWKRSYSEADFVAFLISLVCSCVGISQTPQSLYPLYTFSLHFDSYLCSVLTCVLEQLTIEIPSTFNNNLNLLISLFMDIEKGYVPPSLENVSEKLYNYKLSKGKQIKKQKITQQTFHVRNKKM
ncbi:hypothetical protein RCL1_001133 [Eukaryota sp. TZLM3-RCL]